MDFYVVHSYHVQPFSAKVPKRDVEISANVDKDLASPVCLHT